MSQTLKSIKTDITNLPSWDICSAKYDDGQTMSAIERFIYNNEPSQHADEWRSDLSSVIQQVKNAP